MSNTEIEKKFLLRGTTGKTYANEEFLDEIGLGFSQLERKVLDEGSFFEQFYLPKTEVPRFLREYFPEMNPREFTLGRIRSKTSNDETQYVLEFKGAGLEVRGETPEMQLEKEEFEYFRNFSETSLSKHRLIVPYRGFDVEVDVLRGNPNHILNKIILAEIEVDSENELSQVPSIGLDVSKRRKYGNFYLAIRNYK